MTTHSSTAWPRQIHLPGQAAAPEGPIDMQMMYVMHHGFRRDLDAFTAAVRETPVSARRTWQLLADRWELLTEILHNHHTAEDEGVWPALAPHAPAEDLATLAAMK